MRDEKGRFVKGKSGNPGGRPPKEQSEHYLSLLVLSVSDEDFKLIVKKAVEQAKRGDNQARRWISDYLIGTPVQKTEHSGPEGMPIEIIEVMFPDATGGDKSD